MVDTGSTPSLAAALPNPLRPDLRATAETMRQAGADIAIHYRGLQYLNGTQESARAMALAGFPIEVTLAVLAKRQTTEGEGLWIKSAR